MSLYVSSGWTHYFIGAPLSPRARKMIFNTSQDLSKETQVPYSPLGPAALYLLIEDLGVCPQFNREALQLSIRRSVARHSSFKLIPKGWKVELFEGRTYVWLELKDRFQQFDILRRDLQKQLDRFGFEYEKKPASPRVLCGVYEGEVEIAPPPLSAPAWLNEINLYQRPHTYSLQRGYDCVWTTPLPLEPIIEIDSPSQDDSHPIEDARREALLEQLELRLEERKQNLTLTLKSKKPRRRRARHLRKETSPK